MTHTLTTHHNAPPWGGWLFVAMSLGVAALAARESAFESRAGLALVSAIFGFCGAVVVVRRAVRVTTLDDSSRRVIIEDRTRFSAQQREVPFGDVRGVRVETVRDVDPDTRPFVRVTHRVVLTLDGGEEVPVTDFLSDDRAVRAMCDEVTSTLAGRAEPSTGRGNPR